MKFKILQFLIVAGMISCLFFPMFDVDGISITGFEGMFSKDILLFGNIIIICIVLLTAVHFVYTSFSLFAKNEQELYKSIMNGIVSLNSIFGLLLVTFTGLILGWLSIVFVALMIISALIRYKFLT